MYRSLKALSAAIAVAAFAQGASAAGYNNIVVVRNAVVYYGDLDLATPQGAAVLHERIANAADQACGANPHFSSHYGDAPAFVKADFERCRNAAMHAAIADVRRARVADAY